MNRPLDNQHVIEIKALPSPRVIKTKLPITDDAAALVVEQREVIRRILHGQDRDRLLVIVGPCSIYDPEAAFEYAAKLKPVADALRDRLLIVMRTYFEKPRTTVGWKGLLNDPDLDGSHRAAEGLRIARRLLLQLTEMGIPCATEFLGLSTPHYLGDLLTWAAVGARTSEAQTYREMASALPIPVGFKNGTDGGVRAAIHAVQTASRPTCFVATDPETGRPALLWSRGNRYAHIVLRGGAD